MHARTELLPGVWLIQLNRFQDARGTFVKTFARSAFNEYPATADFELREEFYSLSNRGVIRGMHFQLPPHDHVKLVYCAQGTVLDVLLDLRAGSGYGCHASVHLDADSPHILWIPKGIAHGFLSLSDNSLMVYKTNAEHVLTHDAGVRFDSFGFDWGVSTPQLSDRDRGHPTLADFKSPFLS